MPDAFHGEAFGSHTGWTNSARPHGGVEDRFVAYLRAADPNASSLAIRPELASKRVLLMGDAGAGKRDDPSTAPKPGSIEAQLLAQRPGDLRADVLVVGHHGSKTGSRKAFLNAVKPAISKIAGRPKKYGRVVPPESEVDSVLEGHRPLFRSDRDDSASATNPPKIARDNDERPTRCDNEVLPFDGAAQPIVAC